MSDDYPTCPGCEADIIGQETSETGWRSAMVRNIRETDAGITVGGELCCPFCGAALAQQPVIVTEEINP